jgi:hypothetical protein
MLITELLNELTFGGSRCTKDCSGHKAGYRWALRKGATSANSKSPSFNNGVAIAGNQMQAGLIKSPKVRDDRGRFYFNPR